MNPDAIDLKILAALQADCSISNQEAGFIERQIAILNSDKLAPLIGRGLEAIVEITLDRQGDEWLTVFESLVTEDDAVQQCYRVSPGPDFILHIRAADMPGYLAVAQRLFTAHANVRNVKAFFSVKRAKFRPNVPLAGAI
jgi:Lrp/AsnC family transcriptional regulator, leucine-responsive regulatory protein